MPSINYQYAVSTEVFHVNDRAGVRDAIVKSLAINITQQGTILSYNVAFKKPADGSAVVAEPTLYADIDSALAAYKPMVIVV